MPVTLYAFRHSYHRLVACLNELERNYIKAYKSNNPEFGYNRDTGGGYKRDKKWQWQYGL